MKRIPSRASFSVLYITCCKTLRKKTVIPLTYLAMASLLSLSGSMVMKSGVRLGKDGIWSVTLTIIFLRKTSHFSPPFKQAHSQANITSNPAHPKWQKKPFAKLNLCNLWMKQMPWNQTLCPCAGCSYTSSLSARDPALPRRDDKLDLMQKMPGHDTRIKAHWSIQQKHACDARAGK